MNFRFNKYERVAGLFVIIAFVGSLISLLSVAVKQGWFETKIEYTTVFENADGVHPGTLVQIAGLKAGSVDEVELTVDNKIFIRFYILAKFDDKIRKDSVTSLIRPFVIGERVLDISPGSQGVEKSVARTQIPSAESTDLMTMMSGKKMGSYLATMSEMMGNLKTLADALLSKDRTASLVEMFDRIDPLLKNLNSMSIEVIKLGKQANKDERLGAVLGELAITTKELNRIMPEVELQAPQMAKDMTTLVGNLAELTNQFKVFIPAMTAIAPELPRASRRAMEALDEAVVLMKAMEKSFLVRSNVQEVRDEESKRTPASK